METASTPESGDSPMQIGEVAARTELSVRSLRHWEDVGLLTPSGRSQGGFRLYTPADVEKILLIRRMKPLGFSLDEMREVLADIETLRGPIDSPGRAAAADRLRALRREVGDRRAALARRLEMADEFIALLDREGD